MGLVIRGGGHLQVHHEDAATGVEIVRGVPAGRECEIQLEHADLAGGLLDGGQQDSVRPEIIRVRVTTVGGQHFHVPVSIRPAGAIGEPDHVSGKCAAVDALVVGRQSRTFIELTVNVGERDVVGVDQAGG